MPSIYDLKPRFQNLLRPLTRGLVRMGVTANHVTLAAMLLSIALGLWITWQPESKLPLLLVPVVLLVRMGLNAIDGMIAREHNMKSDLGTFLNELGDVISDAAIYLPLALLPGMPPGLVALAVVLSVISEMAGIVAVQIGVERRYDGPMGKSDRAFVFSLLCLGLGAGLEPGAWTVIALIGVNVMLALTIVNRAARALRAKSSSPTAAPERHPSLAGVEGTDLHLPK